MRREDRDPVRDAQKRTASTRSSIAFSMTRFGAPDSSATSRGVKVADDMAISSSFQGTTYTETPLAQGLAADDGEPTSMSSNASKGVKKHRTERTSKPLAVNCCKRQRARKFQGDHRKTMSTFGGFEHLRRPAWPKSSFHRLQECRSGVA